MKIIIKDKNNQVINVSHLSVKHFKELVELNKGKIINFERIVRWSAKKQLNKEKHCTEIIF